MLKVGDVVAGRYELVEEIGAGGFGVVYRATQLGMNRDVAVKLLHPARTHVDEHTKERFHREAMMARNLNHPHTIRQYDFGETDEGLMYLVLEFLSGKNLVEVIRSEGALGTARTKKMAAGVLKSLAEAHAQGIVHRDLKPGNIMLCEVYGETDYPKVLDFGIAKSVVDDMDLTAAGVALGSPRYMAPELLRGEQPTPAADVYSIAITFAEAVMGQPLLPAEGSIQVARMQLSLDPLPIPNELRSSELYPWLSIGLKKSLDERYASAEEMLRFLNASQEELIQRGADIGPDMFATSALPAVEPKTTPRDVPSAVSSVSANQSPSVVVSPQLDALDEDPNAPTMRIDAAEAMAEIRRRQQSAKQREEGQVDSLGLSTTKETAVGDDSDAKPTTVFQAVTGPQPTIDGADERTEEFPETDSSELPTEFINAEDIPNFGDTADPESATSPGWDTRTPGRQVSFTPTPLSVNSAQQGPSDAATEFIEVPASGPAAPFQPQFHPDQQVSAQIGLSEEVPTEFTEFDANPEVSAEQKVTRRKYVLLLAGLVAIGIVVLFAIGLIVMITSDPEPDLPPIDPGKSTTVKSPTPPVKTEKPEDPDELKLVIKNDDNPTEPVKRDEPQIVTFDVRSDPLGATIYIDGEKRGQTPATLSLTADVLPKKITLRLKRHDEKSVMLEPAKRSYSVDLVPSVSKRKPPRRDRPPRRPKPKSNEIPLFD